ncbi:hypothetical protein C8F04DRAFT_1265663 [Mycena alexandri]|uniref:F-box domain-containing protein n=1 Tax=Mycena alexandri TaxID=1745969 RepID=A0AAD6X1E3_9AGAR|nr:hypothetical protein C8F04DRAFT_1265663 [Mycena alexandri]
MSSGGILSLPNELLIAIATAGQGGSVTVQQLRPEWSLSQVCRRFRDIIVGAPVLWTLIELDLHSDMLADIANLYFTRSQACHLRTILRECKDTDDELIAERLSVIVPHIHRIRQLRIFLFANPQIALAPLRHVAAPNLERLEIRNTLEAFEMNPVEIFSLGAPMLTFICMKCITPHFPVPWAAALTHLKLHRDGEWRDSSSSLAATITTQCLCLAHLSLSVVYLEMGRLHLPFLERLHIEIPEEDQHHLLAIFDLFDTPALAEFTISGTHADQILVLFNSTSLPHSSFPALTSLTFVNGSCACRVIPADAHPITSAPRLFPALSSLSLIHQCFTPHLVTGIFAREQALKFRVPPLFFQYLDVEEDDLDVEVLREIDSKSSSMMQHFELDHIRYGCYSP